MPEKKKYWSDCKMKVYLKAKIQMLLYDLKPYDAIDGNGFSYDNLNKKELRKILQHLLIIKSIVEPDDPDDGKFD